MKEQWPQPIETAPKNETYVLTDVGIAKFFHQDAKHGLMEMNEWVSPSLGGSRAFLEPTLWQPLPDFVDTDCLD